MSVIRHLSIGDLPNLNNSLGRTINRKKYLASRIRAKKRVLLIAEKQGSLAGYIEIAIVERGWRVRTPLLNWLRFHLLPSYGSKPDTVLSPFQVGLIREVFVAPNQRRKGIGGKLVRAGLEWQRRHGVEGIQAAIKAGDQDGENFFSNLGFEPIQFLFRKKLTRKRWTNEPTSPRGEIQLANQNDLPQLEKLLRLEVTYQVELGQRNLTNAFRLVPDPDWSGYASAKLMDRHVEILLIQRDGQPVGFLESHLSGGGRRSYGFIEDVYVLPEYRGQGYATTLAQSCFHRFQSRQVSAIQASIWGGNEASLQFFDGLGFIKIKKMLSKRDHPRSGITS